MSFPWRHPRWARRGGRQRVRGVSDVAFACVFPKGFDIARRIAGLEVPALEGSAPDDAKERALAVGSGLRGGAAFVHVLAQDDGGDGAVARRTKGVKISDEDLRKLNLTRDGFHGEWNYLIAPTRSG